MKLCMQDFVEPKATKGENCDTLQEVSYEDKKFIKEMNEETETTAFDKSIFTA